jgi:uncharacterized DUF497 family protein
MAEVIAGFDWDDGNRRKCQKHGLTVVAIEAVFRGSMRVFPDTDHSAAETRYLGIGRTGAGRHVIVAYTLRVVGGRDLIRPISARYMHSKEVKHYETSVKATEEAADPQDG